MKSTSLSVITKATSVTIPPSAYRLAQARILIVDDMAPNRRLLAAAMSKAGFRDITVAQDGREALEKTIELKPDLIILDIVMPRLDGLGFCKAVRKDPAIPYMPILVQTMTDERETKLQALSCGADDFLYKPLDPAELILRACIHLERYFMLKDVKEAARFLEIEVEQITTTLKSVQGQKITPAALRKLRQHCEVMEEMMYISPFESRGGAATRRAQES